MARKTYIEEEIEERADYFTDWIKKLSTDMEEQKVVNERTAIEFIKESLSRDSSLSNLLDGMESSGKGMSTLVKTSYIQSLIEANRIGIKLDKGVERLRKKRESLERELPKKTAKDKALRRAVAKKYVTPDLAKKYNFKPVRNKKTGIIQYHDRKGRFVSQDKLFLVVDKVVLSSAKERASFDKFLEEWKERNNYKK